MWIVISIITIIISLMIFWYMDKNTPHYPFSTPLDYFLCILLTVIFSASSCYLVFKLFIIS